MCIHRLAGLTGARTTLVTTCPFRAPHHTILDVWQIDGGHLSIPGEVSLAYHCRLALDERPEFRRHVLEVRRRAQEESIAELGALTVLPVRGKAPMMSRH